MTVELIVHFFSPAKTSSNILSSRTSVPKKSSREVRHGLPTAHLGPTLPFGHTEDAVDVGDGIARVKIRNESINGVDFLGGGCCPLLVLNPQLSLDIDVKVIHLGCQVVKPLCQAAIVFAHRLCRLLHRKQNELIGVYDFHLIFDLRGYP